MEKIIILGTGAASSLKFYNSCFALKKNDDYILIDGGGGIRILERLEDAKIPVESIHNIFVTHSHIDHIIGIIWVIRKITIMIHIENHGNYEGNLNIYASSKTIEDIRALCKMILNPIQASYLDKRIILNVVEDREKLNILDEEFIFYDIKDQKDLQYGFRINLKTSSI